MATPKVKPIKYIVCRQFRVVEAASGMIEGGAEAPQKETITEKFSTYTSKKEADSDFRSEVEQNEFRRFLCEVKKTGNFK